MMDDRELAIVREGLTAIAEAHADTTATARSLLTAAAYAGNALADLAVAALDPAVAPRALADQAMGAAQTVLAAIQEAR